MSDAAANRSGAGQPHAGEPLELRVLSGLHREARCLARNDDLLGADSGCDVVLADAGLDAQAARLRLGQGGWDLAPGGDAAGAGGEPRTPFNTPLPLGPVWITVARRSDPWVTIPDAANDDAAQAESGKADVLAGAAAAGDAGTGAAGAVSRDGSPAADGTPAERAEPVLAGGKGNGNGDAAETTADAAGAAALATLHDPSGAPPRRVERAAPSRRAGWPVMLGLAAVALAILVAVLMAWLLPGSEPVAPARPDPRAATEQSLSQINAAIERLGLSSRLRVSVTPSGVAQVSGWVRDNAERDSLAAALAQIWPMPAMRISSETESVRTAQAVLDGFGVKYEPRYDGAGRLNVRGVAGSAVERAAALDAVRAQLPGMVVLGNNVLLAPDVADALAEELTGAGLGNIALTWQDRRLQAGTGGLDDAQMAELQAVLDRFNTRYFGIATLAQSSGARQYADTVPFRIRSVVSGAVPFVVLEDGSKLLVGGTYRRYRLTVIEEKRLVFEGPQPAIVLR